MDRIHDLVIVNTVRGLQLSFYIVLFNLPHAHFSSWSSFGAIVVPRDPAPITIGKILPILRRDFYGWP